MVSLDLRKPERRASRRWGLGDQGVSLLNVLRQGRKDRSSGQGGGSQTGSQDSMLVWLPNLSHGHCCLWWKAQTVSCLSLYKSVTA